MDWTYLLIFALAQLFAYSDTSSPSSAQLDNTRYNKCGRYKCAESGKFNFAESTVYKYLYRLHINSTFDQKATTSSELKLEFLVEIRIDNCEGVMRIDRFTQKEGLSIFEEDETDKIYKDVHNYRLTFSFYDGSIFNVCPNNDESVSSLNIKKGILSAFQNKMRRFDIDKFTSEKDINGICPTYYNLERINGTTLVVRKMKDIANCLERYQLHSIIPTSRYVFQSKFQRWAPLNSTVVCHQTIDNRVPTHIVCTEDHKMNILSNHTYGSRTQIKQELQLLQTAGMFDENVFTRLQYPDDFSIRSDLSFDHKKPKKSEISELEESETLLQQLCEITSEEFQLEAAGAFTKFIHKARHLSYDALDMLMEKSEDICITGRKHVQDSLPFLRSTASVKLMKEIIMKGNLSDSTSTAWLFAISVFSRPDFEVVNSVAPLLLEENPGAAVRLSISSVIHSYRLWANEKDERETETREMIIKAITFMESRINKTIMEDLHPDQDELVVLLKSLGNAGVLTDTIGYTLAACIRNVPLSAEIKITAIEAHRRLPCNFNEATLLDVYSNRDYGAEVRIAAYLQVMRCPSYSAIQKIKSLLEEEAVNQVGTFVWSHFQNMMKSSLEYRVEIQSILQDFYLQKKFKTDFRKFSKNYEASFYLNDYGVGSAATANVIFSTESYIPTYVTLNVTLSIFGELVNVGQIDIFMKGFEKYAEKFFKNGFSAVLDKIEKRISVFRFLRSIPNSMMSKILSLASYFRGSPAEPTLTFAFKLFGNEIKYRSYRGEEGIEMFLNHFDTNTFIEEFLNGEEIKYDYSSVFMDVSYVAPTAAGIPLNLDAVGIAITNFDTSVLVNITNYNTAHEMLVNGKLKPRFSINFEGSMGTDLVYKQTQVQVKSKMYTSTEIEGYFNMNSFDNITLLFNLPLERYDIFSFESEFYYINTELDTEILIEEEDLQQKNISCFWPIIDQALGLKLCSSHEMQTSPLELVSLVDILKSPFKFSLFVEKSDRTAKKYSFKYLKSSNKNNESRISAEFETPGSAIPRSMKSNIYLSPTQNNMTVLIHANRSILEAHGFYKNTPTDKVLNFDVDINGLKHIEWILELHARHDKKAIVYTPKLYLAISSKPVAELAGTYNWTEKKGTSQCNIDLQFKTNKFDSAITGSITLTGETVASNMHVKYKFENLKNERLDFELNYRDASTKLMTSLTGEFNLESTAYPDMNMAVDVKYQTSHDRVDARLEYVSNPFLEDDHKKLYFQTAFTYYKSFNGLKINTFLDVRKDITDVNFKVGLTHQRTQVNSNTILLLRYAKNKDIIVKVDTYTPQLAMLHYELKVNTTLPNVQQPMTLQIKILERSQREYDIDLTGTWFSGHTAMAKGVFQDKSNHYGTNYVIKLLVRSRLFSEISLAVKILFNEWEQKVTISAEHEKIKYSGMITHMVDSHDVRETYLEFVYNNTAVYYLNNRLDLPKKEIVTELHLDKYRDIRVAARGTLQKWNSDIGLELKWDVNRDPSQKIVVSFTTRSTNYAGRSEYNARFIFEYPSHISMASFVVERQGNFRSLSIALEMNPTSVIQLSAYSENELFTKGFTKFGCKLITPFENWKESALSYGLYSESQSFRTNGSIVWQGDQSITFNSQGGYLFGDDITSLTISSSLNSTLQDLSALAFGINYTSAVNEVHVSFLLQPNRKYSLFISLSGLVKYYDAATEYIGMISTRTPFLDYSRSKFSGKLKLMTENRINGDFNVQLNDDSYALYVKGLLNFFEKTKLCLHILTPFEKYQDLAGVLSYDPEEKHVYLNLTGVKFDLRTEIIYVYNNLSNFHLRLEAVSPFSYLSNMIMVGMYNGKAFDMRFGWNAFTVGLAGITQFNSWTDMEYGVQIYTPILNFKQSSGVLKIHLFPDVKIITGQIFLYNITKVGVNFEYNSEKSKVSYQDECDIYYEKDTPGISKTVVLYNGLLELDTLIYPTVLGSYSIKQTGNNYNFDAKAAVFFLKLNIWNNLYYENNLSFDDTFDMKSSIDMLSSVSAYLKVKKVNEHVTTVNTDLALVTFLQHMKGGADVYYEYQPIDGALKQIKSKIGLDGVHNVVLKVYTPFEHLEKGEITIVTQKKNYVFETTADFVTVHTNITLIGDLLYEEDNFNILTKFNMTSDYVTAPPFQLQILRDFSKPEKEIAFVLKEPTELGDDFQDMLSVKSTWYVDNRDRISLKGELKSPLKILKELKASLLYVRERQAETYYLEAYMKYLNLTEMKAQANLKPPSITLTIESSMEGLRNAHFVGTLERIAAGHQKIDAVMVNNNNYRIQGFSAVTDQSPFSIRGKLLRGKEAIEISSVEMYVKKKVGGYNVLASLHSKGKSLNIETEITDLPNNTRIITLKIKTGIGVVEILDINAELKLQHPGIYQLTVKGDSTMEETKGSSVSTVEIWFRNGIGAIFASLDSASLKVKSEFFIAWKPPYHYYGGSKINCYLNKKFSELLNMKIYFHKINETSAFENVTSGLMINLNNKWIMETNFTYTNSTNDRKVLTYLALPNNNTYSFTGGLKHSEKYDQLQHLIIFSRPQDTPCYTISDIDIAGVDLKGLFAFRCGIKETLFMVDKFDGRKTSNKLQLNNYLRSNTLANTLTTNVNYEKRYDHHIVKLKFYYPPTKLISIADVNFQSTDNFNLFLNTSTPFPNLRNFASEIRSKTDPELFWRFAKIHLQDRPAFVNFTHTKKYLARYVLNNGLIQVEFPIATWHQGVMTYTYEDTSSKIYGSSEIFYNSDRVIHSNFTRNSTITRNHEEFFTHLAIGNKFVPVGVNYIRRIGNPNRYRTTFDLKRLEVFKLQNASAFNLTGELLIENPNPFEWTTLRVLNFNRSIVSKWRTDSGTPYENIFSVMLKPELWFSCHLKTNRTIRDAAYKKLFDVNIAYPRRNFSVISDFGYGDRYLKSQFIVQNYLLTPHKTIGIIFDTKKPTNHFRGTTITVFHPSLEKNVTLMVNVSSALTILADIKMELEYSYDANRKFELSCIVEDYSKRTNRNYTVHVLGKHPQTNFKLNVTAALRSETGIHFVGNNILYKRAYLPDQFWNGTALLNTKDNIVSIERASTRALIQIRGDYKLRETAHILNTLIVEGTSTAITANTNISGYVEFDLFNNIANALINLTADASDRLQIKGNIRENREAKFNIWRTYNDFNFPQMTFYLALNHSRFLSSALMWRTDIGTNILKVIRSTIAYMWVSAQDSVEFWTQFLRSEATETLTAVWEDAKPDLNDLIEDCGDMKTIQDNINYFKSVFNDSYNNNEFFLQDIHKLYTILSEEMSFMDKLGSLPKIVNEVVESMGETGEVIKKSLIWVVDTIKEFYNELLRILDELVEGKAEVYVAKFIKKGTEKFDSFIKELHISFVLSTESAVNEMLATLSSYRNKILNVFEPTFMEIVHHIDTTLWTSTKNLVDFIYAKKNDLVNSPYFLRNANFTQKLDEIYKDFSKNDLITNVKKYLGLLYDTIYEYYIASIPYRQELSSIGNEIIGEIEELNKLPPIKYTVDNIKLMYNQTVWLYEYFDIGTKMQRILPFLYKQYQENSVTALEVTMKNHKPKTKVVFSPHEGIIRIEQKLPFPWHAFNETPTYEEIEEYKYLKRLQAFVTSSKSKIWSIYSTLITLLEPQSWFPPFKGHAHVVGFHNFITFDSVHVPFYANYCKYLLSHDFMGNEFSLVLNSDESRAQDHQSISLLSGGDVITIQFTPGKIRIDSKRLPRFPLELNNTLVYYDRNIITIQNKNGVTLKCNEYHRICTLHLSGWFYGKVNGLLGTMNNEYYDDSTYSTNKNQHEEQFLWTLSSESATCSPTTSKSMMPPDEGVNEMCNELFLNSTSPFEPCFSEVDPGPYYNICITRLEEKHVCSTGMAYVQSCSANSVPLRIPALCISCSFGSNKVDVEGQIHRLTGKFVPQSSDVVFIVEAKLCNQDIVTKKNIRLLINSLSAELTSVGISRNRYSLVIFGGDGIYSDPHSIIVNGNVFSNSSFFHKYFEKLPVGNGDSDIFNAIRFAVKLPIRAGVSKTFILMPCSNCDPKKMALDYSVLHHALTEKSIRLHILMNNDFPSNKTKTGKVLFGVDSFTAYTKEDFDILRGDAELHRQTKITKSMLGYCTPLALETNGTLFTASLLSSPSNTLTKFTTTFAKRVAQSAKPEACQDCECHSDENGVPYVECVTCGYPIPIYFDFNHEDENDFPAMLSLDSSSRN